MESAEFEVMDRQGETHWWYRARRRLLQHALDEHLKRDGRARILDLATACAHNAEVCAPYGAMVGLDVSWIAARLARDRLAGRMVLGDARELPFAPASFDAVVALDVLEHLRRDDEGLAEIARVLAPGGVFILNVPALPALFSDHDRAFHHFRRYRATDLRARLHAAGLEPGFLGHWSFFALPAVWVARKLLARRSAGRPVSDFRRSVPSPVSAVLDLLSRLETGLLRRGGAFPAGVSLFGVARRPQV